MEIQESILKNIQTFLSFQDKDFKNLCEEERFNLIKTITKIHRKVDNYFISVIKKGSLVIDKKEHGKASKIITNQLNKFLNKSDIYDKKEITKNDYIVMIIYHNILDDFNKEIKKTNEM